MTTKQRKKASPKPHRPPVRKPKSKEEPTPAPVTSTQVDKPDAREEPIRDSPWPDRQYEDE